VFRFRRPHEAVATRPPSQTRNLGKLSGDRSRCHFSLSQNENALAAGGSREVIGLRTMRNAEPTLRQVLRRCARDALEGLGYSVRQITAARVVPGARLQVKKSGDSIRPVAVRTSINRKVGLTYRSEGSINPASSRNLKPPPLGGGCSHRHNISCVRTKLLVRSYCSCRLRKMEDHRERNPCYFPC